MWAIVKGKVYSSDEAPILILFSHDESVQFHSQPVTADMHCSGPKDWNRARIDKWMNENRGKLIRAMRGVTVGSGVKPQVSPPVVIPQKLSDEKLREMIQSLDPESIENYDDEYGEHEKGADHDDRT